MKIKYIISLCALVALAGASCWAAQPDAEQAIIRDPFEGVSDDIIEQIIAQSANPADFAGIARVSPKFNQVLQRVMGTNWAEAVGR